MGEETERIRVAETSDGAGGSRPAGETVSLPVVELLTGRGFITGKSGCGKSNSASVVAERLLDNEFGLLIVDIDGEYYGLKEEYEILHVGADEECDVQVTTDHAERLAGLALEQNVPIILDVSSYLDESEAEAMLTEVARSLFAKAKKQKQPFLMLVEEIHEYIPEQGSVGECGKMLIKIGKRGRKHGLGLCGVSQRPADVKKDFITQCDWLLWHRLTWQNDTRVVRRILDGKYADAVENLSDGEGFLVTDWMDDVRRVQFHRKETFDAGATPGLEDVERPALKSVSEGLVSELAEISDEASTREDRIAELESALEQKENRIENLERELRNARDLQDLAEQFAAALTNHPTTRPDDPDESVVTDRGDPNDREPASDWPDGWRESEETATGEPAVVDGVDEQAADETVPGETEDENVGAADEAVAATVDTVDGQSSVVLGSDGESGTTGGDREKPTDTDERDGPSAARDEATDGATTCKTGEKPFSAERVLSKLDAAPDSGRDRSAEHTPREQFELEVYSDVEIIDDEPDGRTVDGGTDATDTHSRAADGGEATVDLASGANAESGDRTADSDADETVDVAARMPEEEPLVVRELKAEIGGLETTTRRMLVFYREQGPTSPQNAHFAAGGDGNRTQAYARNRTLRTRGLVGHVGRGRYDYRLREHLGAALGDHVDDAVVDAYTTEIEETALGVDP